jgi:protein TonB
VYCDHCQTTVVEGARFCLFCGGKLTEAPAAEAMDPSQAPTVALTVGPCESCGAPSLPGSTLCLPCTRAFESILGTQPAAPAAGAADAATLLQPQAPVLPSAPGGSAPPEAATVLAAPAARPDAPLADEPLGDDEEYEDEPDDLLAEEAATVLTTAPPLPPPAPEPAAPALAATDSMDWSTPAASNDHEGIVALPPWARKGPDAEAEPAAEAAPEAPGAEPTPWWERNGHQSPAAAAKPEVARYVPPPAAPPASATLESTLARQAMRPKSAAAAAATIPVVPRASGSGGNRRRSLVIGAALAGVAAIGTPVMWKLAFASRPTVVSALPIEPAAAPAPAAPRAERVHGTPAPAPAPAPAAPRVYEDLQPVAPEPAASSAPVAAAPAATHATPKPKPGATPKKPAAAAVPAAAPVAAPEPAPLLVATPPPVVAAAATAAPPPAPVQAEAVPLGQIFEVSQVEARPSVTSRFDPVLPARIASTSPVVVIVRVLVSPSGRAVESSPVKNPSNDAGVGAAAAAIVRQWSFAPARKKGQPVSCWVNVGVVFKAASGN